MQLIKNILILVTHSAYPLTKTWNYSPLRFKFLHEITVKNLGLLLKNEYSLNAFAEYLQKEKVMQDG